MNRDVRLLDLETVSEITSLGRTKIYDEIRSGRLRSIKVGRRRLVSRDAVLEWIDDLDQKTALDSHAQ